MTLKTMMSVSDAIIEELESIKPGEYIAVPANGLIHFMGKNAEGRLIIYLDVEGIVHKIAEDMIGKVSKQ